MHVLILPSWYPTSSQPTRGIFFREQAQALSHAGLQVGVVAPQRQSLKRLFDRHAETPTGFHFTDDNGVPTYHHYGWSWIPLWPAVHAALWKKSGRLLFERYVQQHGLPDIIHVHSALYGGVLADDLRRAYGIPYVLTEHSTAFARGMLSSYQQAMCRRAFHGASARIVVSPSLGEVLSEQFPPAPSPRDTQWEWVPNMVDPRFRPKGVDISENDDATPRRFRWLNIALLTEKKGHRDLLQAFARAFKNDAAHELRIGGDGPLRNELTAYARELDIADRVQFLGELDREQVLAEMQRCDAFVLSSHVETFGVVCIEAMACGKPVIATRCGGPECIVNETNGILAPPRDPAALADAMRECSDDYLRFAPLNISDDCLRLFGGDAVSRQLIAIYEHMLGLDTAIDALLDELNRETSGAWEQAA